MPTATLCAAPELSLPEQAGMVAALHRALQARHPGAPVALIETHISYVLVTPSHAYKLKKAVNPGFLDFTTCALRRHFCEEELRLNRRLAPALYLDVVAVTGSPSAPLLGGAGVPIDHAVRMRAFAQEALWDRIAARGELRAPQIDELAALLNRFHAQVRVAPDDSAFGTPAQVRAPMLDNLAALEPLLPAAEDRQRLDELRRWEAAAYEGLQPVFEQRRRDGRVRECHGDLHLGNVAQIDGRTTVFDCIEFNDAFRWIDVMSEVAFMAMDLQGHGLPALAHRFVDACLQGSGDYDGVRVLRYYIAHRALVRAKVAALRAAQSAPAGLRAWPAVDDPVRHGLDLALAASRASPRALMITHGLSGSGKTTWTQGLLEASGAIRIRADVERKRRAGLDAHARSGSALNAGLYSAAATEATYARLCAGAAHVLQGGLPVVLDATFLRRAQRDQARRVAAACGAPFIILDFDVDLPTLRERVSRRAALGRDASEADLGVLEAQRAAAEPLDPDEAAVAYPGAGAADQATDADWAALQRRWCGGSTT